MDQNTYRLLLGSGQINPEGFDGLSSDIEDVFSTVLYTGDGTSYRTVSLGGPSIFNSGGMSWIKDRTNSADHAILSNIDLLLSNNKLLKSNTTDASPSWTSIDPFYVIQTPSNTTGLVLGTTGGFGNINTLNSNYVIWNFRKRAKFFDMVDYTGNGSTQTISHNLKSTPGCIIVKRLDSAGDWSVWHKNSSFGTLYLNSTAPFSTSIFGSVTSTDFTVSSISYLNGNGGSFRAFLFADNAGGFGADGSENAITCGSFNVSTSDVTVNLGYEPQFLIVKNTSDYDDWRIIDCQRGMPSIAENGGSFDTKMIFAATSAAETGNGPQASPTSTGFVWTSPSNGGGGYVGTHIYIAIRRPTQKPTLGSSVFAPVLGTFNNKVQFSSTFPVDTLIYKNKSFTTGHYVHCRLGSNLYVDTAATTQSTKDFSGFFFDRQIGVRYNTDINGNDLIGWTFRRARGFHDTVSYISDGSLTRLIPHNLGVIPELVIAKNLSIPKNWTVGFFDSANNIRYRGLSLNLQNAATDLAGGPSGHTTTEFGARQVYDLNYHDCNTFNPGAGIGSENGSKFVAHLFASCPGVSKLGTYTGTGASQNINCGFTGSARFVLIKNLSNVGDWVIFDSARGIVAGSDPVLCLNTTAADNVTADCIDPYTGGFTILTHPSFSINTLGDKYFYMAIA